MDTTTAINDSEQLKLRRSTTKDEWTMDEFFDEEAARDKSFECGLCHKDIDHCKCEPQDEVVENIDWAINDWIDIDGSQG